MSELAVQEQAVDPATMELVIVNGDLSKLNPQQRIAWYKARCEAAGLDPRTEPFQYLNLQGKLKLYATKAATDQLISNRKLNVEIIERRHDQSLGVYEVQCRVTFPDKHSVEDFAAIPVKGLIGEQLCNALMKAVTKAKRRTVLSACGLGVMDESEVETVPNAEPVEFQAGSHNPPAINGHGSEVPGPPPLKGYGRFLEATVADINAQWLDAITSPTTGEMLTADAEVITEEALSGHLLKWARSMDWTKARGTNPGEYVRFGAPVWAEHVTEFDQEARRYCRGLWTVKFRAAKAAHKAKPAPKRDNPETLELIAENAAMDELLTSEAGARG
jgi:hypothetical protein